MDYSKYENKLSFPTSPKRPGLPADRTAASMREYAAMLDLYEVAMTVFRVARVTYREEQWRLNDLFKKDALCEVGLADHPKKDMVFGMAWDRGNSEGFQQVFQELVELAELLLN